MMKRPVLLTGLLVLGVVGLAAARQVGWLDIGTAMTDASGTATLTTNAFTNLPPGVYRYQAAYAGDAEHAPSTAESTMTIQYPTLLWMGVRMGPPGGRVTMSAYLYRYDDAAQTQRSTVPGAWLHFYADETFVSRATTDDGGRANVVYTVPTNAQPGQVIGQKVIFDEGILPDGKPYASSETIAPLLVDRWLTGLDMGNRTARAGEWVSVSAYLKRFITGLPSEKVVGKPLRVFVDGVEQVPVKLTDTGGRVAYAYKVPLGQAPGLYPMRAEFLGDSMYQPVAVSRTLTIVP